MTHLCTDRVDANGAVQLLLGQPALECGCKALRHLSSIWTQYVEAHDTFVVFKVTDDFRITFIVIPGWNCPFQWPEETVVNLEDTSTVQTQGRCCPAVRVEVLY